MGSKAPERPFERFSSSAPLRTTPFFGQMREQHKRPSTVLTWTAKSRSLRFYPTTPISDATVLALSFLLCWRTRWRLVEASVEKLKLEECVAHEPANAPFLCKLLSASSVSNRAVWPSPLFALSLFFLPESLTYYIALHLLPPLAIVAPAAGEVCAGQFTQLNIVIGWRSTGSTVFVEVFVAWDTVY